MRSVLTLLCFLAAFSGRAQNMFPYSFSKTTGTYQNLVGSTNLTAGFVWDDTTFTIPLGFSFKWALDNRTLTSIVVDAGGMLYAPDDVNSQFGFPIPTKMIMAYQCDLVDRGTNTSQQAMSPISYLTTGTAPNRICKIEYRNAGFFSDTLGLDSTNFQIWLYEGSNIIEALINLCFAKTQKGTTHIYVFTTCKLRIKSRPKFKKCSYATICFNAS